jgi:hypothetical protein
MSYLRLAQEVEARLRREKAGHECNERNESLSLSAPPGIQDAPLKLRLTFRKWFTLTVDETDGAHRVSPAEAQELYQQIIRFLNEAGPVVADRIYVDEARRFRAATHRCGLCGGPRHT